MAAKRPITGITVIVMRSPVLAPAETPWDQSTSLSASDTSVPDCRWLMERHMEAIKAAIPQKVSEEA